MACTVHIPSKSTKRARVKKAHCRPNAGIKLSLHQFQIDCVWRLKVKRQACAFLTEGPIITLLESTIMARQPNYDFDRRERDRLKKLKNAERAAAKLKPAEAKEHDVTDQTPGEE